ncbi:hypothetical protein MLD38_027835 [Melastoma candidum]|uniref:Uncharacterized protein n=1 Tax=Melastoma candidum TaxID=119954 RepID=A0ACB9P3E9_9MYRT|nr:hypothetical protein MLD38_027835 [Melastoma candidum]
MELWFCILSSLCICISLHGFLGLFPRKNLPPGPPTLPFLGAILWLLKSSNDFSSVEPVLRHLRSTYGDIVNLQIGSRPAIFVMSHAAAHESLVRRPTAFASRPLGLEASSVLFSGQRTVSTSAYTPLWRLLRHNLMAVIHPSRAGMYSDGRRWAWGLLKSQLLGIALQQARPDDDGQATPIFDVLQLAMFSLLVYMCLGEKYDEQTIKEIIRVQRAATLNFVKFNVFNFMPWLMKIVLRSMWKELLQIRQDQEKVLLPLIRSRVNKKDELKEQDNFVAYADTLRNLRLPDTGTVPDDGEMVSLCSEFIIASTDTSIGTMQWVMANIVKYRHVHDRVLEEVDSVVDPDQEICEDDLEKMHYLKAVVLETLRRHPPAHFIIPRAVTEDSVKLGGYDIPKDAIINYTVAEMGRDSQVWEDPMEFRPERFMNEEFDLKGVREIKMMPFGAGRRMCPAITMAALHLRFYVANMVRDFEWSPEDVDMSEVQDFNTVMRTPLAVRIRPRARTT